MGLVFSRNKFRIGSSEYQLLRSLPDPLDASLPTIEALEEELSGEVEFHAADSYYNVN